MISQSQNKKNKYSVDNNDDKGESDVDKNGIKDACSTVDIFNGCFICVYPFYLFYMFYLFFFVTDWVGTRDAYAPNKQYNFGTRLTLT